MTDKAIREAVKGIPGFPDLQVHHWMPTLMTLCKLSEKPNKNEHIYRVAYDCCKNAKRSRKKKLALAA